ncbi:MAG: STAS domain-containing protein [Clostridiales bacterium]|mgnify:FL=1|jgi:anti-sigma B factor antagonist|nr:STAS domain-containing protein [Clostridiales bacterium]
MILKICYKKTKEERSITVVVLKEKFKSETNTWCISLDGEIDIYNAPELKERLHKLIEQHPGNIILNCENLTYIDSTGLGVLISALRRVKEYDGQITIKNLKPYIHKIFVITGLDKIFTIEVQEV